MDQLLLDIEVFCARHNLSDWQFGEMAINDKHLVRQLRAGRDIRLSTAERLRVFMAEYQPPQTAN